MLRSRIYYTSPIEKLKLLWVLCTIHWMQENNIKVTNNNIEAMFGDVEMRSFNRYKQLLMESQYIASDSITLTTKAMRVIQNWQKIQDAILEI
jgi:hypothetical protein